jgi:hypothetical protein
MQIPAAYVHAKNGPNLGSEIIPGGNGLGRP